MFKLLNIATNAALAVSITSPLGDVIELPIGPMISKRDKEELDPESQYNLLNSYLEYKGKDFRQLLFIAIADAEYAIQETSYCKGLSNPPVGPIHKVLDIFDMADIEHFVRDIYKVIPPENLMASFDQRIESDGLGTRAQTYIQQDYYELAAITIPIKVIIGLLSMYGIMKTSSMAQVHKEYILYELFTNHPINNYPSIVKLRDWAGVLINLTVKPGEIESVTVIEKQLPLAELPNYILAVVLLQKISIAVIIKDNQSRNIITRIYNYIINKLKTKGGSVAKIRDKDPLSDTDSSSGDKESMLEAYRVVSNLTAGTEEELDWYVGNINFLIRDMGGCPNMALLEDMLQRNKCFYNVAITKEQLIIAGYIFKDILDPRALMYINIHGIINIISLGFVLAWERGHKEMAMLLSARALCSEEDEVDIGATPNVRVDPEIKKRLQELYPYNKQLNVNKIESVVEAAISEITYAVFGHKWLHNMPDQCLTELFGERLPRVLDPNFKNQLGALIIDICQRGNGINAKAID